VNAKRTKRRNKKRKRIKGNVKRSNNIERQDTATKLMEI
jgi:hypothetical protein